MTISAQNGSKKQALMLIALCFAAILLIRPISAFEQELGAIEIVTGDYPPGINKNANDFGYISRLVSDAFALEGITTKFLFLPWARSIRMVRIGKKPAVMYYAKNSDRINSFLFSDPIFEEQWLFFHLKSTPFDWQKLTDLTRYMIGATLSYSYSEEFNDLADQGVLNVNWVTRDKQNWQMLMAGRIDIFPNVETGWYQLAQLYSKEALAMVTTHPKPLKSQLNYILFSKNHPDAEYFLRKFNSGFAKLKKIRPMSYYIPKTEGKPWPTEP